MGFGALRFGQAWFRQPASRPAFSPTQSPGLQALRLLAFLRVFAPIAQALTLVVVTRQYGVHVAMTPIVVMLGIEVLVAVATWLRVRQSPRVSALELFLQAHLDIGLFALMLYLTGGASNPFAPLFVLPMAIAASALKPRWVWITAISTMVAYALLRSYHLPLFHPNGETEVYSLHEDGMVINYLFTAALLAFFINRMQGGLRRHARMLADARDAQMRSESVVAIGALAAGYAHELSTPLATMSVMVGELKCQYRDNAKLRQDLEVIDDQIKASKLIISNLASAGGQRRAESAAGARLDHFMHAIVNKVRDLHPGATIMVSLDKATPPPSIISEETLRQAITNLIQNAVHASPQHVEVSADWSGADLRVAVRDRGPGFDAAVLQRLGKQIATSTDTHRGLGMGLLLSAATLQRLGGSLDLTNQPGGGACAEIRVPLHAISLETQPKTDDAYSI